MTGYQLLRYWSIVHGCKVTRVSLADRHGQEYFATVPASRLRLTAPRRYPLPAGFRFPMDDVLDQIQDAIDEARGPGEVRVI